MSMFVTGLLVCVVLVWAWLLPSSVDGLNADKICDSDRECGGDYRCRYLFHPCDYGRCRCPHDRVPQDDAKCVQRGHYDSHCTRYTDQICAGLVNGECVDDKCRCKNSFKRYQQSDVCILKYAKLNGDTCASSSECWYIGRDDRNATVVLGGKCANRRCECPVGRRRDGDRCNKEYQHGLQERGESCSNSYGVSPDRRCRYGYMCGRCPAENEFKCLTAAGSHFGATSLTAMLISGAFLLV